MTIPRGGSSAFESPLVPTEVADAPDIKNVPAADSMHTLMGAVAEIHHGVRQILEAMSPEVVIERARASLPAWVEVMAEAEAMAAPPLPTQDGDDDGREAAPLDPALVKAGDTVTLEKGAAVVIDVVIEAKSRGVGQFVFYTAENPDPLIPGTYYLVNHGAWTLTDHQPAPEPEPEWKPGTIGTAGTVRGLGYTGPVVRTDEHLLPWWTPSRVDGAHYHGEETVTDFVPDDDATWRRKYEEVEAALTELAPAPTGVCAHGQTAEDLCNAMPDKIELDAMWTAWNSLTPAEQRGWLEGGEGKVPTPAKVSIRTLMNGGAS